MGRSFPGRKIVIIGGGSVGCELADYLAPMVNDLAPRNRDITIIEAAPALIMKDAGAGRSSLVRRMMNKGINMITKHSKPSAGNPNGGIIQKEAAIDASNVMLVHEGKATRVGFKMEGDKKVRFAKATGKVID